MMMERGTINNEGCKSSEVDMVSSCKSMLNSPKILSGMSHEMRTQMNAIVAFSFLMSRDGCDLTEREEFRDQILASCEQLLGIFDNYFDSAIIETGSSEADFKICTLSRLIDNPLSEFRECIKNEKTKDLVLITENNLTDDADVIIDINKVNRVIRNLFQNAFNSTMRGYIKIGYYFKDEVVTFCVIDTGQGYFKCKEFLHTENLNESLKNYNDTTSAINLTLAIKLIDLLNGSVWVECNGLTGTGIYFSIPVRLAGTSANININNYKKLNSMVAI